MSDQVIRVDQLTFAELPTGKHHLRTAVADTGVSWAYLVVVGQQPGPTLLVIAGIHGNEYEGMQAIRQVFADLDPEELAGRFVGLPVINVPAFRNQSRTNPDDNQNLARVFPGKSDGTVTEGLAHALHNHVFPRADLLCDLHSAGSHYEIRPLAGYMLAEGNLLNQQRRAAVAFGLPFVWGTPLMDGRSLSSARDLGKPAVYVEMPGQGLCRRVHVQQNVAGILNLLGLMKILPDRSYPTEPVGDFLEDSAPEAGHLQAQCLAEYDGFFIPARQLWEPVKTGDGLGNIYGEDGRPLQTVTAEQDGRILVLRATPSIRKGDFCATVVGLPG